MLSSQRVLRTEGRYSTRTRTQVLELLQGEQRYLSATALHRVLQSKGAKLSLSTVYRTLDLLVSMGIASSRVDEEGETTYVFCTTAHHHHAICRRCGHVEEVSCGAMERFKRDLLSEHAFALDSHSMEFYGVCVRCR